MLCVLGMAGGVVTRAAQLAGMDRRAFYDVMQRTGVQAEREAADRQAAARLRRWGMR